VLENKTSLEIKVYKGHSTSIYKIKKNNSKTEYNLCHCSEVLTTEYPKIQYTVVLHSD